ncbi:regulatory protein GemA [Mizugakiibacter sediminis]|nr:regulatory protein GemA [Mizugakiibacter sediminis]
MMQPAADPRAARRRRQLAAIHVARQQLGMDDDAYRDLLARVSAAHGRSVRSSAALDAAQRRAVLDELRRLGAARPRAGRIKPAAYPGRPHNADSRAMPDLITKIEAQLADMKLPWSYADAIARQQHGIARVAWVRQPDQLRAIIAALHVEQEKRDLNTAVDARLKALGWPPERVVELLRPLRPNWRRHRPSLRLVLQYLDAQG